MSKVEKIQGKKKRIEKRRKTLFLAQHIKLGREFEKIFIYIFLGILSGEYSEVHLFISRNGFNLIKICKFGFRVIY